MGGILVKLDLLSSMRGIPWVPHRQVPEHFMVELESLLVSRLCLVNQARSGFFRREALKWSCLEEVFLVTCTFSKKKVHSLSVAPEPLAIWNKKLEGLESELFKELKTSSDDM